MNKWKIQKHLKTRWSSVIHTSVAIVRAYEWLHYCGNEGRSYYRRHFVCSPCNLLYLHQLFTIFISNRAWWLRLCVCEEKEREMRAAGRVACSELMPQIVVRCRSPSAMRFGQEGNVIGFVQSSWQPTPADICSLLTTQTYLHQGTHTHAHTDTQVVSHKTGTCTHQFMQSYKQPCLGLWGRKACPY